MSTVCAVCGTGPTSKLCTGGGIDWPLCGRHYDAFDLVTNEDSGFYGDGTGPHHAIPFARPDMSPWGDEPPQPATAAQVARWEEAVAELVQMAVDVDAIDDADTLKQANRALGELERA